MTDDFVVGGVLPADDTASDEKDFDPDAVDSDAFLDDPQDELLVDEDLATTASDDDDEFEEEV